MDNNNQNKTTGEKESAEEWIEKESLELKTNMNRI